MQIDLFADLDPPATAPVDERAAIAERHAAAIEALPEVLRPAYAPVARVPEKEPELSMWVRETQRIYLLYLIGAIQRLTYRESSLANIRYVLLKLNGLGGEW